MKTKPFFIIVLAGILLIAFTGISAISASQQGLPIEPNRSVTAHPGSYENKRFFITLPEPGSFQLLFEFVPGENYYVYLYSIERNGSLNEMAGEYCYYNGETVTGTYTMEFTRMRLPKGTYIIEIKDANGLGDYNAGYPYTIHPIYTPELSGTYEKENNDKARDAMPVPFNNAITGNLGSASDHDYYKV